MSIVDNKKAFFDYFIEERFEAGLVLEGWEVGIGEGCTAPNGLVTCLSANRQCCMGTQMGVRPGTRPSCSHRLACRISEP